MAAGAAGDKIKRFANRQHNAEVEVDPGAPACRTGNRLQDIRNIRLRALIKLHVGVNRETISTRCAHAFPVAVRLHAAAINAELIRLADGAMYRTETRFDLFCR